jgi:citronellol/citronellal dehydrogenase
MYSSQLFNGKLALVTGGGSGIGFAIARALLQCGAEVWIASRNSEKLEKASEELAEFGKVHWTVMDIRELEQIEATVSRIAEEHGKLDILVNNAGGQFPSPAEGIKPKGWHAVINNNLNGTWYLTQAVAKQFFIPQRQGNIVNITANTLRGFPGMAHTGAARAGVENLTKTLAVEWAPYQIRINAIAPGVIKSTGLDQYPPALLKGISDKIPMKRVGTVDEVAACCLFLASPLSAFTTGESIYLDGGQRLWGDVWDVPALKEQQEKESR